MTSNIYQHIGGGGNIWTANQSGNAFKLPLPNASGLGNALILAITYDAGATVSSVIGAVNGSFGSPAVATLNSSPNQSSAIYVVPNIAAGLETATVTFGAPVRVFQYCFTEVYGVAASPLNGTQSNPLSTTTATGSFTPGNNDVNGGNLLWAYFCEADKFPDPGFTGTFPSSFAPSSGFTLLNADIAWNNGNDSLPKIVETTIQTTAVSINPGFTPTPTLSGWSWNSLVVALKLSPGAGTAPSSSGIRINGIQHFSTKHFPGSGSFPIQAVATGNLRVLSCPDPNTLGCTVSDNEVGAWTQDPHLAGFWYRANTAPNSSLIITVSGGSAENSLSFRFYDIANAATTGTFDSSLASAQSVANVTSFTASPSPSPLTSNGMTIADVGLFTGPGQNVTAPSGAVWDLCTYTGEFDTDTIENADIVAHAPVTSPGSVAWTFGITSVSGNSTSGGFITFVGQSFLRSGAINFGGQTPVRIFGTIIRTPTMTAS